MISRWRIISVISLCIVSTLACGFSTWVWTENSKADVGAIDVTVGNVVDSRDIIQLDSDKGTNNTGISCFEYCQDGFVNDNLVDVNDGYLNIYLKMNVANIKKAYGNPTDTSVFSSLYVGVTLSFSSNSDFNLISESYINPYVSDSKCGIQVTYTVDSGTQLFNLSGNNSIEKGKLNSSYNGFSSKFLTSQSSNSYFYVTVGYRFSIDYQSVSFRDSIYPNLSGSSFNVNLICGGY